MGWWNYRSVDYWPVRWCEVQGTLSACFAGTIPTWPEHRASLQSDRDLFATRVVQLLTQHPLHFGIVWLLFSGMGRRKKTCICTHFSYSYLSCSSETWSFFCKSGIRLVWNCTSWSFAVDNSSFSPSTDRSNSSTCAAPAASSLFWDSSNSRKCLCKKRGTVMIESIPNKCVGLVN